MMRFTTGHRNLFTKRYAALKDSDLQRHRTKQVSADGEVSYTKDVIPYWTEKADMNILEIAEIMGGEDDMGLPLQPMVDQVERSRPHRCESCGLQYAEEAEMVACCFYDPRRRHG